MPVTVPGVVRCSIHGRWSNGHQMANVLDYAIGQLGQPNFEGGPVAQAVGDAWKAYMLPNLLDNYTYEGISWVTLANADGDTGFYPPGVIGSNVGAGNTQALSPQVAVLVQKVGSSGRGQRKGRLYLPPCAETNVDENGFLDPTQRGNLQTACNRFLTMSESGTGQPTFEMVVSHFADPRPPKGVPDNRVGTSTVVQALFVEALVATQRRRLR